MSRQPQETQAGLWRAHSSLVGGSQPSAALELKEPVPTWTGATLGWALTAAGLDSAPPPTPPPSSLAQVHTRLMLSVLPADLAHIVLAAKGPGKLACLSFHPLGLQPFLKSSLIKPFFFFLVHNHALCTDTAAGALRAMSPCPAHSLGADTLFLIRCDCLPHKRPPWAPPAAPSMSLYSSRTLFTQESLGQSKRDTTVAGVTVPPFIKHPSARPGVRTSPRRAASSWDGPRPILPARDPPARRVPPRPHPASPLPRLAVWQRDLRRPAGPATSKSGAREAASYSSASDTARASLVFAHLESPKNPGWSPFYGEELEGESHHPD